MADLNSLMGLFSANNPEYSPTFTGEIPGAVGMEHYKNAQGGGKELSWVQARDSKGRRGRNLYDQNLRRDLQDALRHIFLENYKEFVTSHSGTLREAIAQGELTSDELQQHFQFIIADLNDWRPFGPPVSTRVYGPIVFQGRGPIDTPTGRSMGPMRFYAYGQWHKTHHVSRADPRPVFILQPHQRDIIDTIIVKGVSEDIQAYFRGVMSYV